MSNQAELPPGFGFIWSVDDLETNYPDRIEPRYNTMSTTSIANDRVKPYWLPPNHRDHYKIKREGNLYRWDTEGSKRVPQFSRKTLSLYSTASVFIQARQDNFLVIDQDCRERDVVELDCGWSQLGFNHHMSSGLSEARFYGRDHPYLAAPANGSTWMPQVVPATYNRPIAGPRRCEVLPPLTGGLCGRLAIILALVAFSADVASVERVIANGFRLGRWLEQDVPVGIGRYDERGVVVKIYYDPDAPAITEGHLRSFEVGEYGPIFENGPGKSLGSSSSHSSQPSSFGSSNVSNS